MSLRNISEEELATLVANRDRVGGSLHKVERVIASPSPGVLLPTPSPTIQSFFVPGPLPGANDIIRKHWRVYSKLKADWGLTCARCMLLAKVKPVRACAIAYHWVEPLPRRGHIRDRDNIRFGAKFVNDALVSQGILLDDGPDGVVSLTDSFTYDGVTPGVLVTIEEVKP